jgi:hypothetical protein
VRTISGVRFEVAGAAKVVHLADAGIADISAAIRAVLDATGQLAISEHSHGLPYGAILRLGLDRAVVPSVVPTANDLATALAVLMDCDRLGAVVAERIGLGSAGLYGAACRAAMTAIASDLDDQLAAIDRISLGLEVAGTGHAVDHDGDGAIDEIAAGRWTGAVYSGPAASDRELIDAASFSGSAAR